MKKYLIIFLIVFSFCKAQNYNFDFLRCRPYRFTIFDRKFIDQSMRFEPYTGNATGYTNPLA